MKIKIINLIIAKRRGKSMSVVDGGSLGGTVEGQDESFAHQLADIIKGSPDFRL